MPSLVHSTPDAATGFTGPLHEISVGITLIRPDSEKGDGMLNIARAMMVLAAVFSAQAMGQGTALDGKWAAKFVLPSGMSTGAAVVIRGTEGTWTSHSAPRNNPCLGKETQIAVDQTSTDAVSIKILYSKRLTGCEDGSASLKLVDGVLKGHLGAGLPVELNRD